MRFRAGLGIVLIGVLIGGAAPPPMPLVPPQEVQPVPYGPIQPKEFERNKVEDHPLKSKVSLEVSNSKGAIRVVGWNQSKIRIQQRLTIEGGSVEEAERQFDLIEVSVAESRSRFEVRLEGGRGLPIEQKLKERKISRVRADLTIYAPAEFEIYLWTESGEIQLEKWRSKATLRSTRGDLTLSESRGPEFSMNCVDCVVRGFRIEGELRVLAGSRPVRLEEISSSKTYVESTGGDQFLDRIKGKVTVVSNGGALNLRRINGMILFKSRSGRVQVLDSQGYASGATDDGDIKIEMRRWELSQKAIVESQSGNIELILPEDFSSEVDIWSVEGSTIVDFPITRTRRVSTESLSEAKKNEFEKRIIGRIQGVQKRGADQFKVFTYSGNIRILKGA